MSKVTITLDDLDRIGLKYYLFEAKVDLCDSEEFALFKANCNSSLPECAGCPGGMVDLQAGDLLASFDNPEKDTAILAKRIENGVLTDDIYIISKEALSNNWVALVTTKEKEEPKNNDGREACFWCHAKTDLVDSGMGFYNVCPKCKL
jgi:hypothetical protein